MSRTEDRCENVGSIKDGPFEEAASGVNSSNSICAMAVVREGYNEIVSRSKIAQVVQPGICALFQHTGLDPQLLGR